MKKNNLVLMLIMLLLSSCAILPPTQSKAPEGKGWTTYNQAYNYLTATASVSRTTTSSGYTITKVNTSSSSENRILGGSPLISHDTLRCKENKTIREIDYIFKANKKGDKQ